MYTRFRCYCVYGRECFCAFIACDNEYTTYFKYIHTYVLIFFYRHVDFLGGECGPNWELLAPRGNRFFFPNAVGPAWQGASSTITLDVPLDSLVDFDGKVKNKRYVMINKYNCWVYYFSGRNRNQCWNFRWMNVLP